MVITQWWIGFLFAKDLVAVQNYYDITTDSRFLLLLIFEC